MAMAAQSVPDDSNSVGDFKFIIAGKATFQLSNTFDMFNHITSKEQAFNKIVKESLGGDRKDQKMERNKSEDTESLHIKLECRTDERFLKVFEEFGIGKIKDRLNEKFFAIGIKIEGLVVEIENTKEVTEKAASIIKKGSKISPQIIVQGGAYKERLGQHISDEDFKKILKDSAKKGYKILTRGETAVDAVEAAVRVLEDSEYFNAGYGSLLNNDGEVECDAMIMDGNRLNSGSVTSVSNFQNPVSLAKLIMEKSYHCGLSGEGALKFAKEKGFPVISDKKELITQCSKENQVSYEGYGKYIDTWMRGRPETDGGDTVSAVARDAYGYFACAVSTGGVAGKLKGRVSDASMVGCGGYANEHGAATTSGLGESIIQMTLAREVVYKMEGEKNASAQNSAEESLEKMRCKLNDVGGVIAIDKQGNFGKFFTTPVMGWASIKDKIVQFGMKPGEVQQEPLNENELV